MSDPLSGAQESALEQAQGYMTGTVVPLVVGAVLFALVLRIALGWFMRSVRASGGSIGGFDSWHTDSAGRRYRIDDDGDRDYDGSGYYVDRDGW